MKKALLFLFLIGSLNAMKPGALHDKCTFSQSSYDEEKGLIYVNIEDRPLSDLGKKHLAAYKKTLDQMNLGRDILLPRLLTKKDIIHYKSLNTPNNFQTTKNHFFIRYQEIGLMPCNPQPITNQKMTAIDPYPLIITEVENGQLKAYWLKPTWKPKPQCADDNKSTAAPEKKRSTPPTFVEEASGKHFHR